MEIITLVGPRSVGKSTLGKKLAESLNYDFINLDEYMNKKLSAEGGIAGYTKKHGWGSYNRKLYEALNTLVPSLKNKSKGSVLDCGGGVVYSEFPESRLNADLLKKNSKLVLILPHEDEEKGYEILAKRESSREHFKDWSYEKIFKKTVEDYKNRVSGMKKTAHYTIHVNSGSPEKVIKKIESLVGPK